MRPVVPHVAAAAATITTTTGTVNAARGNVERCGDGAGDASTAGVGVAGPPRPATRGCVAAVPRTIGGATGVGVVIGSSAPAQ